MLIGVNANGTHEEAITALETGKFLPSKRIGLFWCAYRLSSIFLFENVNGLWVCKFVEPIANSGFSHNCESTFPE